MAWKQVKGFDEDRAGNKAGWCLQNVRLGYGISSHWLYPNATKSWEKNQQQHRDRNFPDGVAVPIYYSFYTKQGNEGHVNVLLPDGSVWSDGKKYTSVADYEARQSPDFLGWGESVNGNRVIEWVEDAIPAANASWVGKTVKLSASVDKWAFYRPGTPLPVKRQNRAGELAPKKWGGLSYRIERVVAVNTVEVTSPSLGKIWIYVDKDAQVV